MKFFIESKSLKPLSLIFCWAFLLISCGSQAPMVSDLSVETESIDEQIYIAMGASLEIGNVSLGSITLPIYVPKLGKDIGSVSMYTDLSGNNRFELELAVSEITGLQTTRATLPNGDILPLLGNNDVIAIPIEDKAVIYLVLTNDVVAVGASVAIKGLDSVGRGLANASVFPIFNIDGIFGSAGMYFSNEAGKNGFALFANLTPLVEDLDIFGASEQDLLAQQQQVDVRLDYSSKAVSGRKKRKFDKYMYRLHRRRTKLAM